MGTPTARNVAPAGFEYAETVRSNHCKFGFIEEPNGELGPRPPSVVCSESLWTSFRNCCKGEESWSPRYFIYTLHYILKTTPVKKISAELHEGLSSVFEIIKEIRCKALNSRIFEALCTEMAFESTHLLCYAEISVLNFHKKRNTKKVPFLSERAMRENSQLIYMKRSSKHGTDLSLRWICLSYKVADVCSKPWSSDRKNPTLSTYAPQQREDSTLKWHQDSYPRESGHEFVTAATPVGTLNLQPVGLMSSSEEPAHDPVHRTTNDAYPCGFGGIRKEEVDLVCAFPPPAQGPPQAVFLATRWVCFRCKKLDSDLPKQKPTRHFGRKNCLHKNA
ncbi:hypothetical protein TNCV_4585351 [Trichonephila clavipes]|nr:hypothetical protein TNCV_4585351 [Trichonephila clavipes]